MAFTLAIITSFAYALQSTLMGKHYRKMDRLQAVALRGLSLGLTALPLLYFVPVEAFSTLYDVWPFVLAAILLACVANFCSANAFNYLPMGIASALSMSFTSLSSIFLDYYFGDSLDWLESLCIATILCCIFALQNKDKTKNENNNFNFKKGILNSFLFGIFLSLALTCVKKASSNSHDLLVVYTWEFGIGIFAYCIFLIKKLWQKEKNQELSNLSVPFKTFLSILLCSSPTVIGSACLVKAMASERLAIVTTILNSQMVIVTLISYFLYREKLKRRQVIALISICCLLGILKAHNEILSFFTP